MRWYAQYEVNQDSEQNEVDGMKKGADSTGKMMHMWKSDWWFVMRKIRVVELGWQEMRSEFYLASIGHVCQPVYSHEINKHETLISRPS